MQSTNYPSSVRRLTVLQYVLDSIVLILLLDGRIEMESHSPQIDSELDSDYIYEFLPLLALIALQQGALDNVVELYIQTDELRVRKRHLGT